MGKAEAGGSPGQLEQDSQKQKAGHDGSLFRPCSWEAEAGGALECEANLVYVVEFQAN